MSKATTIAADNRPVYFTFEASQINEEREAKRMNLPTSLVERRKRRASVYCTREYVDFLCCIESIFLANLMLKMMLAYSDGDIVTRIKTSILSHNNEMREKISFLSGSDNNAENQLLLTYIVERYANMWGAYFVRHLRGNSGNLIQKLADSQATRTKVAHIVVYASKVEPDDDTFVSDDTPECRVLWQTATDNVFEMADTDDNNQ